MSEKTVAVLMPGLDGSGILFAPFVARAPPRFETQVVSYPPDRVLDYDRLEARIAEQLPADRPFVLVAESFAGPLALRLSLRGIPGLRGVVLAASFVTPPRPRWLSVLPIGALFRLPRPMWLIRHFITGPLGDVQAAGAASAGVHPDVLAQRVRATLHVDARDAARDCPVSVLCLVASHDWIVARRCSRELLAARPSARVVTLQGPHMILQNQPERAWECISRMLGDATMQEAHFILYVRDQAESAAYYGRVLQLQPFLDVPGMTEFRLLDGSILGIMPLEGAMRLLGQATFAGSAKAPKAELYLVLDDAAGHHRRALEHGATELSPMQERDWGQRAAYSVDGDGHVLAFAEKLGTRDGA